MRGEAKCKACGHTWNASFPWSASAMLECPKCGAQKSEVRNCVLEKSDEVEA